jgi:hypothetical protein
VGCQNSCRACKIGRFERADASFCTPHAKALRKAIRNVFGEAPVQRCVRHKERNVTDHLPERERPQVKQRLRRAWALDDHVRALEQLRQLAGELERTYPGAAGSLREGMEETLTSSATATSPPSSSRSNATTTNAVTPMPLATRPRRPLSSQRCNDHAGTAAENPRRAGHPPGRKAHPHPLLQTPR